MTEGTWDTFQLVHILDPNRPENKDYENWCGSKWRKWMSKREEENLRLRGSQRRQVDSKGCFVNSVLIASPSEVLESFKNNIKKYDFFGKKYWSNRAFKMFLIDLGGVSTEVRRCEPVYFVATLDRFRRPIRFKMFNTLPNTNTRNQCVSTVLPDSSSKSHPVDSFKRLTSKLSGTLKKS